ncbi:MAG: glycosyltransferase family 4 protein [Candidatus Bathyarchaeia archaeon]
MTKKICMFNDCASVGFELAKGLKELGFEVKHYRRSRGIFDKTIKLAWTIARSEADLYYVHYALQDAYLVSKLKRLDVLHVHGSDVRWELKESSWRWMIKHNLKVARHVICATPDLPEMLPNYVKSYSYLPNPIDTETFKPGRPYRDSGERRNILFLYPFRYDPKRKGTHLFMREFEKVKKPDWKIIFIRNVPYHKMPEVYDSVDVVIGEFAAGVLGKVALEGMSCGRPVVTGINPKYYGDDPPPVIPLANLTSMDDPEVREWYGKAGREYVIRHHDHKDVASRLVGTLKTLGLL